MPSNVVKTKRDERLWAEAKKSGKGKGWNYVMGTYMRMRDRVGGKKDVKKEKEDGKTKYASALMKFASESNPSKDRVAKEQLRKMLNKHNPQMKAHYGRKTDNVKIKLLEDGSDKKNR